MEQVKRKIKCEIYRDSMQNYKKYAIPPAQLIIADVPYNIGKNFYGSNPMWYNGGDNKNGESKLAGKAAFNSDFNFNLYEYFHFCSKMMKKEDARPVPRGQSSNSPCMIVFCAFEQMSILIDAAKKHGFVHYIPLVFCKNYSPQVLKANMRIVGATEYALVLYRGKLPKFRNGVEIDENGKTIPGTGHMVFNWFVWERDGEDIPKIHPAQKPVKTLKRLIEIFTDEQDVVIDPCCGSGATLRAAAELGRSAYGFEIDRTFYTRAKNEMLMFKSTTQTENQTANRQLNLFDLCENGIVQKQYNLMEGENDMTIQEFAKALNGREYYFPQFTREEIETAKGNGFVIVYGSSDDLMEFEGAIQDEIGCFEGGAAWVKDDGVTDCPTVGGEKTIEAVWCGGEKDDNGQEITWTYKTDIPHATFMIYEDDEPYCRGIVFSIDDLK